MFRAGERLECMWVAESHGQTMGFVVVKDREAEQIFVDRAARGTGVAAMLLRKAEAEIRSAGHRQAWLAVVAGNQRARSFYSRLGWRDSGAMTYMAETEVWPTGSAGTSVRKSPHRLRPRRSGETLSLGPPCRRGIKITAASSLLSRASDWRMAQACELASERRLKPHLRCRRPNVVEEQLSARPNRHVLTFVVENPGAGNPPAISALVVRSADRSSQSARHRLFVHPH